MDIVYKIKREDGLYSSGGEHPRFNKYGKVWKKISDIKRHFTNVGTERSRNMYANCVIVEYMECNSIPVELIINENEDRRQEIARCREKLSDRRPLGEYRDIWEFDPY